jgi:hypothetical protein
MSASTVTPTTPNGLTQTALRVTPPSVVSVLKESFSVRPPLNEDAGNCKITALPGGRFRVRAKGQHCDVLNRNGRKYPSESTWGKHTQADSAFIQKVKSRRVIGQLEHPESGRSSMGLAAVVVTEVYPPNEQGEVFIEFETMSTAGGQVVSSFIRDGVGFGLSSRGNGSVLRVEGADVVQPDFEPITFDLVVDESTPGAEVTATKIKEAVGRVQALLMESVKGDEAKAREIAEAQTRLALARDFLSEQKPPRGDSEYLFAVDDGSAHYRAYENGVGQWDVWFEPHNLDPVRIATAMPTLKNARGSAEEHLRLVVGKEAPGAPAMAVTRSASSAGAAPKVIVNVESKVAEGHDDDDDYDGEPSRPGLGHSGGDFDAAQLSRKLQGHIPGAANFRVDSSGAGFLHAVLFDVGSYTVALDGDDFDIDIRVFHKFAGAHTPHTTDLRVTDTKIKTTVSDAMRAGGHYGKMDVNTAPRVLATIAHVLKESRSMRAMRESFVVTDGIPFTGTMLTLQFETPKEAEKAADVLADAGWNCFVDDIEVLVYSDVPSPEQAIAAIRRVLVDTDITMAAEGRVTKIRQGRVIKEARFTMKIRESEAGRDAPAGAGEHDPEEPTGSDVRAPGIKVGSPKSPEKWEADKDDDKDEADEPKKDKDERSRRARREADDDDKDEADDDKDKKDEQDKDDKDEADDDDKDERSRRRREADDDKDEADDDEPKKEATVPTSGSRGDSKTWRPSDAGAVRMERYEDDQMAAQGEDDMIDIALTDIEGDDAPMPSENGDEPMVHDDGMPYETSRYEADDDDDKDEADEPKKDDERSRRRRRHEADEPKKDKDEQDDDKDKKDKKDEARRSRREADDDKKTEKKRRARRARRRYEARIAEVKRLYMAEVDGGFGPNVPIDDPEDLDHDLDTVRAPGQVAGKPKEKDPSFAAGGMTAESRRGVVEIGARRSCRTCKGSARKLAESRMAKCPTCGLKAESAGRTQPRPGFVRVPRKIVERIRALEREIIRLEGSNGHLSNLVDEMARVQAQDAIKAKVESVLAQHPSIRSMKARLDKCASPEAVTEEVAGLLAMLRESRKATLVTPLAEAPKNNGATVPANGATAHRGTSVVSTKTEGAPTGPLLAEGSAALPNPLRETSSTVDDTASRVADYRRRHRRLRGDK